MTNFLSNAQPRLVASIGKVSLWKLSSEGMDISWKAGQVELQVIFLGFSFRTVFSGRFMTPVLKNIKIVGYHKSDKLPLNAHCTAKIVSVYWGSVVV